jgi:hypothetical protein
MRLAASGVATLLCACGSLSLGEGEIAEICQDLNPIDVPPAPAELDATVHSRSALEIPPELTGAAGTSELELTLLRVVLSAEGVSDLGFVDEIELSALTSGSPSRLAFYERSSAAPSEITLLPAAPVDLAALSVGGAVELDTAITGSLPASPWTLLPRACYAARAALTWSAQ